MARKIPDLEQPSSLKIQAAYNDSYLRPSQETNAGALMQIENSLKDWMPAIVRKTQENTKIKENFENAQGRELARKAIAAGDTRTIKEILDNDTKGIATDYTRRTKAFMHGAYQQRHINLAVNIKQHMLQYGATATITDKNGNTIPISQADDQEQVINTYLAEAERYAKETTGGKYDPVLYQEYIKPQLDEALDTFISLQAKNRIAQTQQDYIKNATGILNGTLQPYIMGGALLTDGQEAQNHTALTLAKQADILMSAGLTELETAAYLSSYIQTLMKTTAFKDRDNADKILQAAKQIPILQDPAILESLTDGAKKAKDAAYFDKQQKDEIEQDRLTEEAFDLYKQYKTTKNPALLDAFKTKDYKSLQAANRVKEALDKAAQSHNEMETTEYYNLTVEARRGRLNRGQAYLLWDKMSNDQQDYLDRIIDDRESDIKRITGTGQTRRQALAEINKASKMAEKAYELYLPDKDYTDNKEPDQISNYLYVKNMLIRDIENKAAQKINAIANPTENDKQLAYTMAAGEVMTQNKALLPALIEDPKLVHEKDKNKIKIQQAAKSVAAVKNSIENPKDQQKLKIALDQKDTKTLIKILKKKSQGIGDPAASAAKLQADYDIISGSDK